MSKNYEAKLTLQDNWNSVIEKAINATSKLEAEFNKIKEAKASPQITPTINKTSMRAFEAEMKRIESTKINIGAKADSSVTSTLNSINRKIDPEKTIHIKATDEVTRTVSNVQRNLFTMEKQISMGIGDNPFGKMSSSATSATHTLSNLINGMTSVSNVSRLLEEVSAGSVLGPMLGAGAGGATIGILGGFGGKKSGKGTIIDFPGTKSKGGPSTDKHKTTAPDPENPIDATLGHGEQKNFWYHNDFFNRPTKRIFDGNYADIIDRQKDYMSAHFGNNNYLPKMNSTVLTGNGFEMTVAERQANIFEDTYFEAIDKVKAKFAELKQKVSSFAGTNRATIGIKLAESNVKERLSQIKNKVMDVTAKPREIIVKTVFAGERVLYNAKNLIGDICGGTKNVVMGAIDKTKSVFSKIGSGLKEFGGNHPVLMKVAGTALKGVKAVGSALKGLTKKAWTITVKVAGGAMKALKGIGSKVAGFASGALKGGLLGAGAGLAAGLFGAVKGGSDLEQNQISMQHFIGLTDPKNAKGKTDDYMKYLNGFANKTPFGNAEVMDAGRSAVTATSGDIGQAKSLTELAGNMAALNPGKSIGDAMEALKDLKTGETERMKEFGFKISADDIKKAGGTDAYFKSATGGSGAIGKTFAGGADSLSNSTAGKWSTFTGNAQSALANVGKSILPILNGPLDSLNKWFDKNGDKIAVWGTKLSSGISKALNSKAFKSFEQFVGTTISGVLKLGEKGFKWLGAHSPQITKFCNNVKKDVDKVVAWIQPRVSKLADWFTVHGPAIKKVMVDAWNGISAGLSEAWKIIGPIFDLLGNVARIIADIFLLVWPTISGALKDLWKDIKPILDLFSDALSGIAKFAGWVADKLDGVTGKKKDVDKASKDAKAQSEGSSSAAKRSNSRAVGMAYIPYNGYEASLHRGEAILTRQDADAWREGRNGSKKTGNIQIIVNGADDPDKVAKKVYDKLMEASVNMA